MNAHSHVLLFDTNVFGNITRAGSEAAYARLFHDFGLRFGAKAEDGFFSFVTPFLLLEYLGVQPSSFPDIRIPDELTERDAWKNLGPFVFQEAVRHFSGLPELSEASLRDRYQGKMVHASEPGKSLIRTIVERLTDRDGFTNLMKLQLGLDYSYGYDYKPYASEADLAMIHMNALLDLFRGFKKGANLSQVRGAFEATDHLRRINRNTNADPRALDAMKGKIGLKRFKDRGDLDILHLASVGAFLNGAHHPVTAFTADPEESVRSRLEAFKTLLHHLVANLRKSDRKDLREAMGGFTPKEGRIVFVEPTTGGIRSVVAVSDIAVVP